MSGGAGALPDRPARMGRDGMTWQQHAACRGVDVNMFPGRGESLDPARAVCATCRVTVECLAWALATGQTYGVWGGTSERERRRLRTAANRQAGDDSGAAATGPIKGTALKPITHGMISGYRTHLRRGEKACERCLIANAAAKTWRKRQEAA